MMDHQESISNEARPTLNVIKEGDQVVFHREGWSRVFQIRQKRQVYLDKNKLDIDALIGQPYGSTFEVDRGKLVKMEAAASAKVSLHELSSGPGADNRNLLDLDSNQKMSKEDIMKMKDEGVTGQKIIEELIENSETFKAKTEFSKEKYLKKKKKKHIPVFTVLRPTPRLVLDIFSKEPGKICYLRADSLSQLLSYSNAMNGSCVGVVDTCQGLVLSCLLQRVGAAGKVVQLIPNMTNAVCRQVMDYLGYPKNTENVYTYPMDELSSLNSSHVAEDVSEAVASKDNSEHTNHSTLVGSERVDKDQQETPSATQDNLGEDHEAQANEATSAEKSGEGNDDMDGVAEGDTDEEKMESSPGEKRTLGPNRELQRQRRAERQQQARDIIKGKELDSLVIAGKYNPTPIMLKMLEFLRPSVPVVIYCQHLEPLVECYTRVKEKHVGLQLKLSETWFREYQILQQRTHPNINMSGTGGYLFTFITTQSS